MNPLRRHPALSYSASESVDLGPSKARQYPDPEHQLDAWVKLLLDRTEPGTLDVGYLYDEALLDAGGGLVGGGATHAWIQVYLPGVGWVEFDPTNALVGGRNLIRVAVAREAAQAAPLIGSFTGTASDFLALNVTVEVTAE